MRVRGGEAPHTRGQRRPAFDRPRPPLRRARARERTRMRARPRRAAHGGARRTGSWSTSARRRRGFTSHGIDPAGVAWTHTVARTGSGSCRPAACGESERVAEWAFSLTGRAVTPLRRDRGRPPLDRPIRPVVASSRTRRRRADRSPDRCRHGRPRPAAAGDEELFDQAAHHERRCRCSGRARSPPGRGSRAAIGQPTRRDARGRDRRAEGRPGANPVVDDILLGVRRKRD